MKKGKLLIIDDNEDILFALNLLLEPYMEQIRVATQPERIDHFMRTFIPDIILLDMNFKRDAISGQEGFYWLGEIKKIDPDVVVLFMTAYSDTDKAVRAIKQELPTLSRNLGKRRNYSLHSLLHWNFGRVGRKCEI